ncbi:MAG TPA: hypothetical protein VMR52_01445 [Dehalococcoidia bacterium]|nr:hypothetical protein [Dehalococcoidia bacterium]
MQLRLNQDEAWSLMMLVTAHAIDNGGLSTAGKEKIRQWQRSHAEGSAPMIELAGEINHSLGAYFEESTNRLVKRRGRYGRKKEMA